MKFLENVFRLLTEHLFRDRIVDTNRRYHFKGGVDMGRVYLCIDLNNAEKIIMPKKHLRIPIIHRNPL